MLLQSHTGEIDLLPALPTAWPTGSVRGLVARGGFELSMEWQQGRLLSVHILSKLGKPCKIRYGEKVVALNTEKGRTYVLDGDLMQ